MGDLTPDDWRREAELSAAISRRRRIVRREPLIPWTWAASAIGLGFTLGFGGAALGLGLLP
jgi:hypothetical protein